MTLKKIEIETPDLKSYTKFLQGLKEDINKRN